MSDRELLAAAQLACDQSVWDRCINTSEKTKSVIDFEQRFPMPFKSAVLQRTAQIELDPAYVYGLIRQESRFIMDAQSTVGASGLMQVMPATARWTARKIGLRDFKPQQITERDTNIAIGTGYLKLVLESFDGSMALAAAAYNAGPSRSRNWRGQDGSPQLEAAIWAENVPFAETRDYVKKVLSNTTNYAALITGKPQSLKARLGSIGPMRSGKSDLEEDLP
jgi:soluble lytic murein transglycosylase